jgi:hypothetical protein
LYSSQKKKIQMSNEDIQSIKLNYEKEGWTRCLTPELNFVWLRQDGGTEGPQSASDKHRITRNEV